MVTLILVGAVARSCKWRGAGALYGAILGFLLGLVYGMLAGAIMGLALGIVNGLLLCAVVRMSFPYQLEMASLLRKVRYVGISVNICGGILFTLGMGLLFPIPTAIAAVVALFLSSSYAEYAAQELSALKTRNRHQVLSLY